MSHVSDKLNRAATRRTMSPARTSHAPQAAATELYVLRLYVAGSGRQSMRAAANIKQICERYLKDHYQLEVIDLYQQPQRAKIEQIIAIPTLIKELPLPVRRIIGDLADAAQVCASLDICCQEKPGAG
jgi:circadian clock protein KaiB